MAILLSLVRHEISNVRFYYRDVFNCLLVFVVFVYAGYIAAVLLQDKAAVYYHTVREIILGGGLPENIFLYILIRNSLVSLTALVLGILTFNMWPILVLMFNGAVSGFAVKMQSLLFHRYSFEIWLFGLLPHGVPELAALFLACGASFYYRRLRNKGKFSWTGVARTFFIVVMPLLVLAAALETYVTPVLIFRFLM